MTSQPRQTTLSDIFEVIESNNGEHVEVTIPKENVERYTSGIEEIRKYLIDKVELLDNLLDGLEKTKNTDKNHVHFTYKKSNNASIQDFRMVKKEGENLYRLSEIVDSKD